MSDSHNEKAPQDEKEALQKELQRETKEGKDSVGDVSENRTLSGSSTWDTLPENKPSEGRSKN